MNKVFVTSDTHFGHDNIIKYCNRPFSNSEEMNKSLIERWNSRVSEADTVVFLGDFAMGRGVTEQLIVSILNRLNGYKFMILGNHDMPSKYSIGLKAIVEKNQLEKVTICNEQIHSFKHGHVEFVCCHYPLAEWDQKHRGSVNLHGHVHTEFNKHELHQMRQMHRYDIGVDMYGGPVQITDDMRYLNDPHGWAV